MTRTTQETRLLIRQACSTRQADVIIARLEGHSWGVIANRLGIGRATVREHYQRGTRHLKIEMAVSHPHTAQVARVYAPEAP